MAATAPRQSTAAPAAARRLFLALRDVSQPEPAGGPSTFGFLQRELYRQALLLAAHESGGIVVQDATIDPVESPQGNEQIIVDVYLSEQAIPVVQLWHGQPGGKPLVAHDVPAIDYDAQGWVESLEAADNLSRQQFADWIRQRYRDQPLDKKRTLTEDERAKIAERLDRLDLLLHFLSVRDLHDSELFAVDAIESLQLLTRAYAELGALARHHWSPAHKAYSARALIYAQRLVQESPNRPQSLSCRAYAWALAGLQVPALKDLEAVAKLRTDNVGQPEWLQALDAYLHYDVARLQALATGETPNVRASWFLLDVLKAPGVDSATLRASERLFESAPSCLAAFDLLHDVGGVALHHRTSLAPWSVFFGFHARLLEQLDALPQTCREPLAELRRPTQDDDPADDELQQAEQIAAWGRFLHALRHGGTERDSKGEPSWNALGDLLHEATYMAALRRARFLKSELGGDVGEFLEPVYEALRDHPCRPWLLAYSNNITLKQNVLNTWMDKDSFLNWQLHQEEPLAAAYESKHPAHLTMYRKATLNFDKGVVFEVETMMSQRRNPTFYKQLQTISPHSPRVPNFLIRYQTAEFLDRWSEWEQSLGEHPMILGSLGQAHKKHERWPDAQRCLSAYLKLSPDEWAYIDLAECYAATGDEQQWRTTLESALDVPDLALTHAQVRVMIANRLMDQGNFREAQPYAESAAESYAHWAMNCAVRCYEGLEDWKQAELWVARAAQRYPTSGYDWYDWCLRTQRGDRDAAYQLVAEALQREAKSKRPEIQLTVAYYKLVEGNTSLALELFRKSFFQSQNPYAGLHTAILLHERGDAQRRDKVLQQIVERGAEHQDETVGTRTTLIEVAKRLKMAYQQGGLDDAARADIDATIHAADERDACNIRYFLARFLEIDRNLMAALPLFRQAADGPPANHCRILAAERLRRGDAAKRGSQDTDI